MGVFYSERGGEFSLSVHDHEADAYADLLAGDLPIPAP
jgi:hypothetical protein